MRFEVDFLLMHMPVSTGTGQSMIGKSSHCNLGLEEVRARFWRADSVCLRPDFLLIHSFFWTFLPLGSTACMYSYCCNMCYSGADMAAFLCQNIEPKVSRCKGLEHCNPQSFRICWECAIVEVTGRLGKRGKNFHLHCCLSCGHPYQS